MTLILFILFIRNLSFMKKANVLISLLLSIISYSSHSSIIYINDIIDFNNRVQVSLVEDFELLMPKDITLSSLSSNGVNYRSAGSNGILIASPGYDNFGLSGVTTSSILTATGPEDFWLDFTNPTLALGFDTYLNEFGPATISLFGENGLIGQIEHNHSSETIGFFGAISSEFITSIRFTTIDGQLVNTGIDNIRFSTDDSTNGPVTVAEPSITVLMAFTLIFLGIRSRKRAF